MSEMTLISTGQIEECLCVYHQRATAGDSDRIFSSLRTVTRLCYFYPTKINFPKNTPAKPLRRGKSPKVPGFLAFPFLLCPATPRLLPIFFYLPNSNPFNKTEIEGDNTNLETERAMTVEAPKPLWTPTNPDKSQLARFQKHVAEKYNLKLGLSQQFQTRA
jgi:hypothetical protein